jgi:transposase InsO family protein
MVDDFSKFTLLRVLENLQSATVAGTMNRDIVWAFGKPTQLRTDGGPEFRGDFRVLCEAYAITHITTPPFAPWRNGRAERMIRTVKLLIRKMGVEDPQLDWELALPQIQGALNFSVSRVTGRSPGEVFLGL